MIRQGRKVKMKSPKVNHMFGMYDSKLEKKKKEGKYWSDSNHMVGYVAAVVVVVVQYM